MGDSDMEYSDMDDTSRKRNKPPNKDNIHDHPPKKIQTQIDNTQYSTNSQTQPNKNSNSSQYNTLPKINEYPKDISSPYKIIVQQQKQADQSQPANSERLLPLKVARMITPLVPNNSIDEFKSSGRNKVTIITYNRLVANNILTLDVFQKNKLETLIPNSYIFKRGVIKNIPADITDQEILQNLELSSPVENLKIHSIRRFYRNQLIDNTPTPTPTTTVLITFRGQVLPQFAFLYRVRHPVEVYIPKAKLCTNCSRHDHTKLSANPKADASNVEIPPIKFLTAKLKPIKSPVLTVVETISPRINYARTPR